MFFMMLYASLHVFGNVLIKIGLIIEELHFCKIINRISQVDAHQTNIIADFGDGVIYIFQIKRFIAISMGYRYGGLE